MHEVQGANKSPHLESAMFALSAEQNDLIHAAWRNCWFGESLKEKRNKIKLKWHLVSENHQEGSIYVQIEWLHFFLFRKGDKNHTICCKKRLLMSFRCWQLQGYLHRRCFDKCVVTAGVTFTSERCHRALTSPCILHIGVTLSCHAARAKHRQSMFLRSEK